MSIRHKETHHDPRVCDGVAEMRETAAFVGEVLPPAGCTRRLTSTPAAEERGSKAEIEFIERLWQTEMRR